MPLQSGSDSDTVSSNIRELLQVGYKSPGQAVAIALKSAGKSKHIGETSRGKSKGRIKRKKAEGSK
jgi:hypothetical protein